MEIRIHGSARREEWRDLEGRLGLKELIVAGENSVGGARGREAAAKEAVGEAAAGYLSRIARKGDVVGLSAGTTVAAFVRRVPDRAVDLEIVPMTGSLWETGQDFDGTFLCQELRRKTSGTQWVLSAPAVVRNASLARALRAEPRVKRVFERYRALDYAFVGIGAAAPDHPVVAAARSTSPGARRASRTLLPRGAAASVACLFFDGEGKPYRALFDSRTIGIPRADFEKIPVRIGLAAGAAKLNPTLALLKGRNLEVLIVDEELARLLGKAVDPSRKR